MDEQNKLVLDPLMDSIERSEEAENSTLPQCTEESIEKHIEPLRDSRNFVNQMRLAKSKKFTRRNTRNFAERMRLAKASKSYSTEEIEPIAPPEPWTPCRLRQNVRDTSQSMLTTVKEEEPWDDSDIPNKGSQNATDMARNMLTTVKVEEPWEQHEDTIIQGEEVINTYIDINDRTEPDKETSCGKKTMHKSRNKRNRNTHQEARMKQFKTNVPRSLKLQRSKMARVKRVETEEQRSKRLQRGRNYMRARRARMDLVETKEQRSLRLELERQRKANKTKQKRIERLERRARMSHLKRFANETEEERTKRLDQRKAARMKYKEERSVRPMRSRTNPTIRIANETEEEKNVREERRKMARLKRIATETEEGRSRRLESMRRSADRRKLRMRAVRQWISQQSYLAYLLEKTIKDEVDTQINTIDNSENGMLISEVGEEGGDYENTAESFADEIGNLIPQMLLHSPTQSTFTTRDISIKTEPKEDRILIPEVLVREDGDYKNAAESLADEIGGFTTKTLIHSATQSTFTTCDAFIKTEHEFDDESNFCHFHSCFDHEIKQVCS